MSDWAGDLTPNPFSSGKGNQIEVIAVGWNLFRRPNSFRRPGFEGDGINSVLLKLSYWRRQGERSAHPFRIVVAHAVDLSV